MDLEKYAKELMTRPRVDKGANMPHFNVLKANIVQQADLLTLPRDKGYTYLLVIIDCYTHKLDAEPLKNKQSETVRQAIEKIYKRKIVQLPQRFEVDNGTEFKSGVKKYFEDKGVFVRVAETARHRQQAMVERANQTISVKLFRKMIMKQLETNELNGQWVDNLRPIIDEMNKLAKPNKKKIESPKAEGESKNIIPIGTKVRVALEAPEETTGEKLHGKFRSVDIRYSLQPRTVKEVLIKPNSPPLYLLDGHTGKRKTHPVAYTKNQLQIIKK